MKLSILFAFLFCTVTVFAQKETETGKVKSYKIKFKSCLWNNTWIKCRLTVTFNYNGDENQLYFHDKDGITTVYKAEGYEYDDVLYENTAHETPATRKKYVNQKSAERDEVYIWIAKNGERIVLGYYKNEDDDKLTYITYSTGVYYETGLERTAEFMERLRQQY